MKKHRFYSSNKLQIRQSLALDQENSHHIISVLRLKVGQKIVLFDNTPYNFKTAIEKLNKKAVLVKIISKEKNQSESDLYIHLGQAMSKGQKMDYIIQKAVELGVKEITPIISARTIVKINSKQIQTRVDHWNKIAINACCQCSRSIIPIINFPTTFNEWVNSKNNYIKVIFTPEGDFLLNNIRLEVVKKFCLTIGPEGGFSDKELSQANANGFIAASLGPRTLRTETAGIVAIAVVQYQFGDLARKIV